jgi:hypothetical protein
MKGVVRMAVMLAVAPLSNPRVTDRVSPLPNVVARVESLAHTSAGSPRMLTARSTRWMPVADSGPTGASAGDNRQLSGGRDRNLSWLKLPSNTSGIPRSPARQRSCSSITAGSNRRS